MITSVKINWFKSKKYFFIDSISEKYFFIDSISEKYFCTDELVKIQITGSISEYLTDSDLESKLSIALLR